MERRCFACCCYCCCPPPYLYQQASLFLRLALPLPFSHLPAIQNSKWEFEILLRKEINFKEKGKDKPGRRRKEPRIRGSELSSRLPRLTPLSLSSSSSSSAIPATGRLYPRNQTPPSTTTAKLLLPKNEKKKKKNLIIINDHEQDLSYSRASVYILFHLSTRALFYSLSRAPLLYILSQHR